VQLITVVALYYDVTTSRFLLLLDFACRGMPLALGPAFIYQKDLLLHHRRLQQMNNILHLGDIIVQQKQLLL
jgi:hypothetical protein